MVYEREKHWDETQAQFESKHKERKEASMQASALQESYNALCTKLGLPARNFSSEIDASSSDAEIAKIKSEMDAAEQKIKEEEAKELSKAAGDLIGLAVAIQTIAEDAQEEQTPVRLHMGGGHHHGGAGHISRAELMQFAGNFDPSDNDNPGAAARRNDAGVAYELDSDGQVKVSMAPTRDGASTATGNPVLSPMAAAAIAMGNMLNQAGVANTTKPEHTNAALCTAALPSGLNANSGTAKQLAGAAPIQTA